MKTKTKRRIC